MVELDPTTTERRGRPRRFDEDTERTMILDAAIGLLAKNGDGDVAVVEILAETGLSTRSFYRYFESKETLLVALLRREAELVARTMERAIAKAGGPVAAIEAWLDCLLDTFFETRRAARSALFTTPAAAAQVVLQQLDEVRWILARPLAEVLRAGHDAGILVSPNPRADAVSVFALAGSTARSITTGPESRESVRAQVVRFAWPALRIGERTAVVGDDEGRRLESGLEEDPRGDAHDEHC